MADNSVNLASPTGTAAADDIGGVLYQRVKFGWGIDGTWNETDTATGKPIPMQLRGSDGTDRSNLMPVSVSSIAAGTNNIGDVDVLTLPALPAGANAIGSVTVTSLPTTPAGTNNIGDVDVLTLPALPAGNNNIGDVDVASLPVAFNAGAASATTLRVTIDSGQVGTLGQKVMTASVPTCPASDYVAPVYALTSNMVSGAITTAMTGTTTTSLVAAPGASLRNYITTIIVSNAHATVGTDVVIQDGSGGTALLTIPAAAVYGGAVITLPTPLRQPTANTALFCANVTTGASTKVSAVGYKAA
jgi:hypothetical protein